MIKINFPELSSKKNKMHIFENKKILMLIKFFSRCELNCTIHTLIEKICDYF